MSSLSLLNIAWDRVDPKRVLLNFGFFSSSSDCCCCLMFYYIFLPKIQSTISPFTLTHTHTHTPILTLPYIITLKHLFSSFLLLLSNFFCYFIFPVVVLYEKTPKGFLELNVFHSLYLSLSLSLSFSPSHSSNDSKKHCKVLGELEKKNSDLFIEVKIGLLMEFTI